MHQSTSVQTCSSDFNNGFLNSPSAHTCTHELKRNYTGWFLPLKFFFFFFKTQLEWRSDILINGILLMYATVQQMARFFLHNYITTLLTWKLWDKFLTLGTLIQIKSTDLSQFSPPNARFQCKVLTVMC